MKKASESNKDANAKLKLPALTSEVRQSLVEILNRPLSDLSGHQAFKSDQKKLALWAADCADACICPFLKRNTLMMIDLEKPLRHAEHGLLLACLRWL